MERMLSRRFVHFASFNLELLSEGRPAAFGHPCQFPSSKLHATDGARAGRARSEDRLAAQPGCQSEPRVRGEGDRICLIFPARTNGSKVAACALELPSVIAGTNIAGHGGGKSVAKYAAGCRRRVSARLQSTHVLRSWQALIQQDIREHSLNRIVVASSPLLHEPTFRRAIDRRGLKFVHAARCVTFASTFHGFIWISKPQPARQTT